MSKYTFTCEYTDLSGQPDGSKITLEVQEVALMNVIEAFERFLKGAGFMFDGYLDIVNEDEYPKETYEEDGDEETTIDDTYSGMWPFPKSVELYDSQDVMPMPGTLGGAEIILPNKCKRCGLTKEQLGTNTCYDENCGLKL